MAPGIIDMQLTSISGQKYNRLNADDEPRDLEATPLLLSASSSDGEGERNLENRKGLEKLEVKVIGMTCAACSNSVEKYLLNLAGVYTASVALLQNKADVNYDPSKVKLKAVPMEKIKGRKMSPYLSYSKTYTTRLRRKEGSYINKSPLTLGTVIAKLTDGKATHVPYKDSKLTRLLQSSLSGHGRVSIIDEKSLIKKYQKEILKLKQELE